jgi:glycosyltransferase involved in cell wall biosynthesis
MACARPVLLQVDGEARQILEESGGGFFVPPGDSAALASQLRRFADVPRGQRDAIGRAGLAYVRQHYLREQQVPRLAAVFNSVVAGREACDAMAS